MNIAARELFQEERAKYNEKAKIKAELFDKKKKTRSVKAKSNPN